MKNLIIGSSHSLYFSHHLGKVEINQQNINSVRERPIKIESHYPFYFEIFFIYNQTQIEITNSEYIENDVIKFSHPFFNYAAEFDSPKNNIILLLGGNEQNVLFLTQNKVPFDFYHPQLPNIKEDRQLIPTNVIWEMLSKKWESNDKLARFLCASFPLSKKYFIAPPPTLANDSYLINNDTYFDLKNKNIEDSYIRLKVYEMYLNIVSATCEKNGIVFIPPDINKRDKNGYLLDCYKHNFSHASPAYYESTMQILMEKFNASLSQFS